MGDVGVEEFTLDGQVESGANNRVDVAHGLGGEAGAVPPARRGEVLVEAIEVIGPEPP